MFSNFSMIEMAVIVIVAILVVGPKDLPKMLRGIGKTLGTVKRMAGDFQRQFKDAIDDAELNDIKDSIKDDIDPLKEAKEAMSGIKRSVNETVDPELQVAAMPAKEEPKAKASKAAPKKAAPKKTAKASTKTPAPKKAAPKNAAPKKAAAKTASAKAKTPAKSKTKTTKAKST